jgi:hypothetical protein
MALSQYLKILGVVKRMIGEVGTGKGVKGSGRDLIEVLFRHLSGGTEEN